VSLAEVAAAAAAPNVALVEAEQTAVKAHAASKLAKMAYFPEIALFGGWAHQSAINAVLPEDFAYVGVMATYTLFDGLKRERSIKESHAQSQAAQLGVELTKAKAAAAVRTSYFDLERSRGLVQLARMITPAPRMADARYIVGASVADPERTRLDIEWLRAELEYRQAYARLNALLGGRSE
jgi:outer membrane protein TolC